MVGSLLAFFKGKIENVKVDLMVIEGDQDLQIRGTEGKRLAKIAGPALQEASLARGRRSAGNLRVTPGYQLPCQLLAQAVHTMGTDLESLKLCYLTALNYAREKGVRTVSFSLLGTVLSLKCPPDAAAKVALGQISAWLQSEALGSLEKIILCAHGPVNQKAVKAAIEEWVEKDLNPPVSLVTEAGWGVVEDGTPTGPDQATMDSISQELKASGLGAEAEWRAQPLEPEPALEQWGSTPEEKQFAFQGIVETHLFKEFRRPVELEAGPCTPLLEVIPGDGDCLFTAVSKYLDFCHQDPLTHAYPP